MKCVRECLCALCTTRKKVLYALRWEVPGDLMDGEQKVSFYMETTNVLLFSILLVLIINALFVMALMFEEN